MRKYQLMSEFFAAGFDTLLLHADISTEGPASRRRPGKAAAARTRRRKAGLGQRTPAGPSAGSESSVRRTSSGNLGFT